ncbi:Os02g0150250, partial [Oryza sativa Japonica Group]
MDVVVGGSDRIQGRHARRRLGALAVDRGRDVAAAAADADDDVVLALPPARRLAAAERAGRALHELPRRQHRRVVGQR